MKSDSLSWRENNNTITTNTGYKQHCKKPANRSEFNCKPNYRDKISLGIACCRFNDGKPEIIMVRKRFTYAFNNFGHGRYNSGNTNELIELFNEMTSDEKHDILSMNFAQIWYRIWLNNSPGNDSYMPAKIKFENSFALDNGERLKRLIAKSVNVDPVWEIPKGKKKNKNEHDIHCAIREFKEETGISKRSYKIFPQATRTYSYIDAKVNYINTYFLACSHRGSDVRINFAMPDQVCEISDIRWMGIEDIRFVDKTKRIEGFVKPIFAFMKKYAR